MFVLQNRIREWDKWETIPGRYATIEEAEAVLEKKSFKFTYRIAEEYTVVRYKAVKSQKGRI